jgi:hypothetical protein
MIARQIADRGHEIVAVFNSPAHGDHWLGNEGIRRLYPDTIIYGHPNLKARSAGDDGRRWLEITNRRTDRNAEGEFRHYIPGHGRAGDYGSIESIMVRVARQLEGDVPGGPGWHQALPHAMGLDVESVRPAVFSQETVAVLGRLLGCRHFFRHAYAVERAAERLKILRGEIVGAAPWILDELQELDWFLAQVAQAD